MPDPILRRFLGKLPPRRDPRTFKLARYLRDCPPAPEQCFYQQRVHDWGMMLNDQIGDCVIAAMGHMLEQWTTYADGSPYIPTNQQILDAYRDISGYVLGDPSTDNGCDLLTSLSYWRKTGLSYHKIAAFAEIHTLEELHQAVYLFGNAIIGLALPQTAQDQTQWFIDDTDPALSVPGSWGGHCVPIVGYDENLETCISWGGKLSMTPNFFRRYSDEAYAVVSADWIEKNADAGADGKSPSGFDIAQLEADLQQITG